MSSGDDSKIIRLIATLIGKLVLSVPSPPGDFHRNSVVQFVPYNTVTRRHSEALIAQLFPLASSSDCPLELTGKWKKRHSAAFWQFVRIMALDFKKVTFSLDYFSKI